MEKLMKPAEYAKELGISRQAVYAKIKRGILTAKDVEGKLYIVVDKDMKTGNRSSNISQTKATSTSSSKSVKAATTSPESQKDYEALLAAKDETIKVLKGTVKDLKKSNKQISTTLRGEIDLLKEAFHEMRTLYMHQLEHKESSAEAIDVVTEEVPPRSQWISIKKFFKQIGLKGEKKQERLLKRFKKAWKNGDSRIDKVDGKWKVDAQSSYEDIVK